MSDKLIFWLANELNERGWSQRELARRADIAPTTINEVLSGRRNPTFDFCAAIAGPLEKHPFELFVMAGLVLPPARPERSPVVVNEQRARYNAPPAVVRPDAEDVMDLLQRLDNLELQQVYDFARFRLHEQEHRRDSSGVRAEEDEESRVRRAVENLTPEERESILQLLLRRRREALAARDRTPADE